MSTGDKLIIVGVMTIPASFTVGLGIDALINGSPDWIGMLIMASATVSAGLITTGILMRKNR